ncbi:hypothetical protein N802_05465 [Knoellia sinensis KCTC 19936]|uniref:Uncharacterized protein n=1 Tax=Knoellia sinensis KCTC 19936 TaxID=1385520 RepID=A0A0A0J164_9MICO|nr:hypothetical protein N802_05465 [Knoellia sinensis KCTC 19936]
MVNRFQLKDLIGLELSAACYVRDYVELHFDGPILRCLADPIVVGPSGRFEHPNVGSRDALCALVGDVVSGAVDESTRLCLEFAGQARVFVPKQSPSAGPEVAHLVPFTDGTPDVAGMLIWPNQMG